MFRYISETMQYKDILTIEGSYALYRKALFSVTLGDRLTIAN